MNKNNAGLAEVGKVLLWGVVAVGVLGIFSAFLGDIGSFSGGNSPKAVNLGLFGLPLANASDTANTPQSLVTVGNAAPVVSGVKLNNNADIVLTPYATTTISLFYVVSDNNGCTDINTNNMTSTLSVASSACALANPVTSTLSCYLFLSRTTGTCVGTSYNVTDTFDVWYFANSTGVASATLATTSAWYGTIVAIDASASTSLTVSSSKQDMGVLIGLTVTTSTINYGSMAANSTSTADSIATTTNAGNATTSLLVSALATLTSGVNSIVTSSQHYTSSSGVTWENSTALSATAAAVAGYTLKVQTSTVANVSSSRATFWRLQVPGGTPNGSYNGTTTFASQWSQ